MRGKKNWFEPHEQLYLVLWWIDAGQLPTIEEAKQRLQKLRDNGPTADAFAFPQVLEPSA